MYSVEALSPEHIKAVRSRTAFIQTFDQYGTPIGTGSGFLISSKGDVATNYHVVQNAHSATVKFLLMKDIFEVKTIVQKSPENDLAILRINWNWTNVSPLALQKENSKPRVGEKVYAFGSPRGFEGSVTDGIISAYRENGYMQVSAPISPGSSGGPIVNENGKVVGVATMASLPGTQNLNFAVPSWVLLKLWQMPHANLPFNVSNLAPMVMPKDEVRSAIDSIKMEIQREAIVGSLTSGDLQNLYNEAIALRDAGDYANANGKMHLIFDSLEKLPPIKNEVFASYLILACQIQNKLEEPDRLISLAKLLLETTSSPVEKGFAYGYIGEALLLKIQPEKAVKYFEYALRSAIKNLGEEHSETSHAYNNLGLAYMPLGDYESAIRYLEKALAIYLKIDPAGISASALYNNLGMAYDNLGKHDESIQYYKKSLSLAHKTFGADHPEVATNYNNLGLVYANVNDGQRAIAYLEKAFEIYLSNLGDKHPKVGVALTNIGDVYERNGVWDKALEAYQAALPVYAGPVAQPHPQLLYLYGAMARVYASAGLNQDALVMRQKELAGKLKVHRANDPVLFDTYYQLAMSHQNSGQHETAVEFFVQAMNLLEPSSEPPSDYRVTLARDRIAFCKMGNYRLAIGLFKKVIREKMAELGPMHEDLAFSYHFMALSYFNLNDFDNALICNEKALTINIAKYGDYGDGILATDYMEIGNCHRRKNQLGKAKEAYGKAFAIRTKFFGANDPLTTEAEKALSEMK